MASASASRCAGLFSNPRRLLARRLHASTAAAASSPSSSMIGGGVRRPLQPQPQPQPRHRTLQLLGGARHSTIWRKVQEGIQGKQAEKEGACVLACVGGVLDCFLDRSIDRLIV